MNIIVCVKQVIDSEAPPSAFSIDTATLTARMCGANPVLDPFAEHAVEAALRIKETTGARITVISLGDNLQRDVLKKPLAMGADELILLEDAAFAGLGSRATAEALATAIRKTGVFDLILCGREASDTNAGQTGSGIAEILGLPCVTLARKIAISDSKAVIEKTTAVGYDVVETVLPAVVTVSNEIGEPRYPTIKGIMTAKKIEPVVWKPDDIGPEGNPAGKAGNWRDIFQPVFEGSCEFVESETPEETGAKLAFILREAGIL